ncbi:MAG: MFS transporter [Burkholderiaceae bacterium]
MTRPTPEAAPESPAGPVRGAVAASRWALLFGNFVIGCGVMSVAGAINDLSESLQISVSLAGQLITIAAVVMCFGAPLAAGWVSGFDRRRLLAWAMVWYAVGHAACALMPNYAALWPVRAATMLAAAVFSPQAAAAMGVMAAPAERGRAIAFIFLGWSIASVFGLPLASWVSATFGWRSIFELIAALSAAAALWVFASMPDGVRPAALSLRTWQRLLVDPLLMPMVLVTALLSAGQFTLFSYLAPYYRERLFATPLEITLLFACFGIFGLIGNLFIARHIDRIGPGRAVFVAGTGMLLTMLAWPLGTGILAMGLVTVPWALGCFSSNSAQQARLGNAAPMLAPALMALNTSAMYLGQAGGAAGGGWLVAHPGYDALHWLGAAWVTAGVALSVWVARRALRGSGAAVSEIGRPRR